MRKLRPKWYWVTRGIGAFAAMYELLIDHSTDRGTIILAAFGVMGLDFVARKEQERRKHAEDNDKG